MKTAKKDNRFWLAVAAIFFTLLSCNKSGVATPDNTVDYLSANLLPGESAVTDVSPGIYQIARFIDTGDDETAQFNGYTFDFQSDNDLIATDAAGNVYNGTWRLNSAGTVMELNIRGNAALKDLDDDDWRVKRLTDKRIALTAPGPDAVAFVKI